MLKVVWWFVCSKQQASSRQAGRQRQGGRNSCWLVVVGCVGTSLHRGGGMGDGRMEGREGMEAEGEQDARCEVWDWLEGNGRSRKTSGSPERDLGCVATQKLMHVSTACPPPDRRRTARDLDDNNCEDISRQQEWQIKNHSTLFRSLGPSYWRDICYLQRVSSRTAPPEVQRRLIL